MSSIPMSRVSQGVTSLFLNPNSSSSSHSYRPVSPSPASSASSSGSGSSGASDNESPPRRPRPPLLAEMSAHSSLLRGKDSHEFLDTESQTPPVSPGSSWPWRSKVRRRPVRTFVSVMGLAALIYIALHHFLPDDKKGALFPFSRPKEPVAGMIWEEINEDGSFDLIYDADDDEEVLESWEPPPTPMGLDLLGTHSFEDDPNHVLVPQLPLTSNTRLLQPIKDRLPARMLSSYFIHGMIDPSTTGPEMPPMDLVYLWVNASDGYFQDALEIKSREEGVGSSGRGKRYRDNGELRGALRAAYSALKHRLGSMHVVSGDYSFNLSTTDVVLPMSDDGLALPPVDGWRMGQVPVWLNYTSVKEGDASVRWHFHSSVFRQPLDDTESELTLDPVVDDEVQETAAEARKEEDWREEVLPNFNSFAIESRVGWIDGLSENFLLANDDMFILNEMSQSDFQHPLLGSVFRMDPGPNLRVNYVIPPTLKSTPGEWGGLQHAAKLIADRFTRKKRMYMAHMPKALTLSLTHEASVIWADELSTVATRGFRQSKKGVADVEMSWLVSHLRIERWREALLWTWAVARMGGNNGMWGAEAREEIMYLLGLEDAGEQEDEVEKDATIIVKRGPRTTFEDLKEIVDNAGWEDPKYTRYYFTSMDGVLPERPDRPFTYAQCPFSLSKCLPPDFFNNDEDISADAMFKHLTFVEPDCGDCLVSALITASGPRGLQAFFPEAEAVFFPPESPPTKWQRDEPMLPLTKTWFEANFSVESVVKTGQDLWRGIKKRDDEGVNLRQWCIKLLSRYAYVMGDTPTQFSQIHSTQQLMTALNKLDSNRVISMACINDDQPDQGARGAKQAFSRWMQSRWWEVEAPWERAGIEWDEKE